MANYAGLSYGNEVYCDGDIISILDSNGTVTGTGKCFQVYSSVGASQVTVNGDVTQVGAGQTIDVIINTITWAGFPGAPAEGICIVCTCHDCDNPDGNAARAVNREGNIINPSSPYTLIGMGYLNS